MSSILGKDKERLDVAVKLQKEGKLSYDTLHRIYESLDANVDGERQGEDEWDGIYNGYIYPNLLDEDNL